MTTEIQKQRKWKQSGQEPEAVNYFPAIKVVNQPRFWMTVIMLVADVMGWTLSLVVIWGLGNWLDVYSLGFHPACLLALVLYFVIAVSGKLYQFVGLNPVSEMRGMFYVVSNCIGLAAVITMLDPGVQVVRAPLIFILLWLSLTPAILFSRWFFRIGAVRLGVWGEPVVLLSQEFGTRGLLRYFGQRSRLGMRPSMLVGQERIVEGLRQEKLEYISLHTLLDLPVERFSAQGILTLVVDMSAISMLDSRETKRKLFKLFKRIIFISDMEWIEGASIQVCNFESMTGLEFRQNVLSPANSMLKRLIDICGALALGLLSLPIWLLTAFLIKRESDGSVLFTQNRIGKEGHTFRIYKFRTMVENAEQELGDFLALNPAARQEWEQTQKLKGDPRITRLGKWFRRFSIDELPQLLNVLKGDMSLVGPRPIVEDEKCRYDGYFDVYASTLPGLSGLWQVLGRNDTTYEERVRFDVYYARNWSIWLDLYILARTVWVVLTQNGAH